MSGRGRGQEVDAMGRHGLLCGHMSDAGIGDAACALQLPGQLSCTVLCYRPFVAASPVPHRSD